MPKGACVLSLEAPTCVQVYMHLCICVGRRWLVEGSLYCSPNGWSPQPLEREQVCELSWTSQVWFCFLSTRS